MYPSAAPGWCGDIGLPRTVRYRLDFEATIGQQIVKRNGIRRQRAHLEELTAGNIEIVYNKINIPSPSRYPYLLVIEVEILRVSRRPV